MSDIMRGIAGFAEAIRRHVTDMEKLAAAQAEEIKRLRAGLFDGDLLRRPVRGLLDLDRWSQVIPSGHERKLLENDLVAIVGDSLRKLAEGVE